MTNPIYAVGSQTQIAIVQEATPGVTPATPAFVTLPSLKMDLEPAKDFYDDNSIQGDRMKRYVVPGTQRVTGSMSSNLSHVNFVPLLQTACFNTFQSGNLKTGTTLTTLTIAEWHADVGAGELYMGCFANKMAIKCGAKGIVTIDSTIDGFAANVITGNVGANLAVGTGIAGATVSTATAEQPFTHLGGTFKEGGTPLGYFSTIDVNIDNGAQPLEALGQGHPIGYAPSFATVSGSVTAYFPDATLMNKFLSYTVSSIDFTLTDGSNTLQVILPKVTYKKIKKPVNGQGPIMLTLDFESTFDSATQTNILIIKS